MVAAGGLPALGIASRYARAAVDPQARAIAAHWALIALAMFFGAVGLYWAGGRESRVAAVALLLVIAVNGLAVSMVVRMRRGDRGAGR